MNIIESPKRRDNPVIPVSVEPGIWRYLLGFSTFSCAADALIISSGNREIRIDYGDIKELSLNRTRLEIITADNSLHHLRLWHGHKYLALLTQLVDEKKRFTGFKNDLSGLSLSQCVDAVQEFMGFVSQPYVMAVEAFILIGERFVFSDLHFEPVDAGRTRISARSSAEISNLVFVSAYDCERLLARLKYLSGCLSHITDQPQEGAFKYGDASIRLSTFPTDSGERLSLRFIRAVKYPDLDSLGWPDLQKRRWRDSIASARGLFVIAGPVGSGKTTAMYATLAEMAATNHNLRVVTIEDPVEARINGICQSSLDSMKQGSLASAFKHLLRQDPDVLALGEIRDAECVREALQAALSGHLVLATFHAGSAAEAIDRIRQMGIDDYLVMSGLKGILHLDLVCRDKKTEPVVEFSLISQINE